MRQGFVCIIRNRGPPVHVRFSLLGEMPRERFNAAPLWHQWEGVP